MAERWAVSQCFITAYPVRMIMPYLPALAPDPLGWWSLCTTRPSHRLLVPSQTLRRSRVIVASLPVLAIWRTEPTRAFFCPPQSNSVQQAQKSWHGESTARFRIRTTGPRRAPISKPSETAQRTRRDETPFSALEAWHPEEGGTTKRGEAGVPSLSLPRATQTRLGGEKEKKGGPRCLAKKGSLSALVPPCAIVGTWKRHAQRNAGHTTEKGEPISACISDHRSAAIARCSRVRCGGSQSYPGLPVQAHTHLGTPPFFSLFFFSSKRKCPL